MEDIALVGLVSINVLATIFQLFLFALIWRYLSRKPLGMQTPLDQMIKDLLVIAFASSAISNLTSFKIGPFALWPDAALGYFFIEMMVAHCMFLHIFLTVLMRYIYIFHASWLNELNDDLMIACSRYLKLALAVALASYEMLAYDYRQGKMYQFLTRIPNDHVQAVPSPTIKIMIVLVLVTVASMQIRIELSRLSSKEKNPDLGYSFWTLRSLVVIMAIGGMLAILWLIDGMMTQGDNRLLLHSATNVTLMNLLPVIMISRHPQLRHYLFKSQRNSQP